MIEELKEHIYGYSPEGKPEIVGPPTPEELMDKINEIIRHLTNGVMDEKEKMKNELLSWANARLEKIGLILNKRHDPLFSGQRYLLVDLIEKLNHF